MGAQLTYSSLHQILNRGWLSYPDCQKVLLGTESEDPQENTNAEREEAANGDEDPGKLQPAPGGGDKTR